MPVITGEDIEANLRRILQDEDPSNLRNLDEELLAWINEAQRTVCQYHPEQSAKRENLTLVAGARQTLPNDALLLLNVVRNMGPGGNTPGDAIKKADVRPMNALMPAWRSSAPQNVVSNWFYDPARPKEFEVYPPANAGIALEIVYAAPPADLTALSDTISISDFFVPAIENYALFRLYSKDAEDENSLTAATGYFNAFMAQVGGAKG